MSAFSEKERARLKARLDRAAAEYRRAQSNPAKGRPALNPKKWEDLIGVDSDGKPLPPAPRWLTDARRHGGSPEPARDEP